MDSWDSIEFLVTFSMNGRTTSRNDRYQVNTAYASKCFCQNVIAFGSGEEAIHNADFNIFGIPGILGGVGPTYSFVQLVQGVKDLFWLPVEQYRRDGRIMRGLQRGASSFTTSSATAFIELTNKLVQVVHVSFRIHFSHAYILTIPQSV